MRRFHLSIAIFSGLIIIIMLIFAFCVDLSSRGTAYSAREDITDGWTDQSGKTVSLSRVFEKDSPDKNTFTHEINGSTLNGRGLCLVTHNIRFTVTLGDEIIYEFYPQLGGIYGMRYGEAVHTIDLPSFTGKRTLAIKAESLRSDGMSGCNELYLQSTREFVYSIIHSEVVKLGLCIITFFFGVMLFIVGIIEDKLSGRMLEPVCLGATTLIVSAWIGSQTLVMRLLSHNPAMLRAMEYLALCVLPIPVLMFYSSITKNPKNKCVIAAVIAAVLNTLTTLVLVCCGAVDYAELLIVSHIIIFVGVILLLYLVIRVIVRKEMSRSKTIYFTSALIVLAASGMFDMIRYYVNRSRDFTFVTLIGLLVYAVILAIYEYKHIIEMQVRSSEAELMQALAMEDTLTGLGSRAAFVAAEKELRKRTSGQVLFVHFDVNFLKKVNDEYGHAEGDRHLKATAKVLSDSFAEFGKVYRVGGDEFFAILDGGDLAEHYEQGITNLEQAQIEYNQTQSPPVPLQIAHGMAEYDCSQRDPEIAERLADSRMYEHKRSMKQAANA